MVEAVCSWSGGKDCCLALYKALQSGIRVRYLLNTVNGDRSCFHELETDLIRKQADHLGIPLLQLEVNRSDNYEPKFKQTLARLKSEGLSAVIFGDIYLDEPEGWNSRIAREAGMEAVKPLWGLDPAKAAAEFVDLGFKALIISCKDDPLGKEFAGRIIDHAFLKEVVERGCCPCGEKGEFHSYVMDGPIFKNELCVTEGEAELRGGHWPHWIYRIKNYSIRQKGGDSRQTAMR